MIPKQLIVSLCAFVLGASQARAATYTYTGKVFTAITDNTPPSGTYTTSMSIAGRFTVASPLTANLTFSSIAPSVESFSFFDGRNTITNLNVTNIVAFDVSTDASGNISLWDIVLTAGSAASVGQQEKEIQTVSDSSGVQDGGFLLECVTPGAFGCFVREDSGFNSSPGTWSSATPLPAALPLFATGLGGLGLLGWRRKRKAQ